MKANYTTEKSKHLLAMKLGEKHMKIGVARTHKMLEMIMVFGGVARFFQSSLPLFIDIATVVIKPMFA